MTRQSKLAVILVLVLLITGLGAVVWYLTRVVFAGIGILILLGVALYFFVRNL